MDTNLIIGLLIGAVLGLIFIAMSIPEFKKLKKHKDKLKEKELQKDKSNSNSTFDLD